MRYKQWVNADAETVIAEIRKLNPRTRKELLHMNSALFRRAKLLNVLDVVMPRKNAKGSYTKWTDESILAEAKKYTTESGFHKHSRGAYEAAKRHNLLDSFTFLERHKLHEDKSKLDCVYVYEFSDKRVAYVGRTIDKDRRHTQHLKDDDSVTRYAIENHVPVPQMKVLVDNISIGEGTALEAFYVDKYKKDGWILLNKAKAGGIGGLHYGYTKNFCYTIAKQYDELGKFSQEQKTIYNKIIRKKWTYMLAHLKRKVSFPTRIAWKSLSVPDFIEYVRHHNYKSESEFQYKHKRAYNRALSLGVVDKCIVTDAGNPGDSSRYEELLMNAVHEKKKPNYTTGKHWWCDASAEDVCKEAEKYSSKTEFRIKAAGAFDRAVSLGIISALFPVTKWKDVPDEKILEIASNYKNATEMHAKCRYVYLLLLQRHLTDKVKYAGSDKKER